MILNEAEQLVTNLKAILTDEYWGDIYYLTQDMSLPEAERGYDVYVEYHGEFNFDSAKVLMDYCKTKTVTLAFLTHQIIIY